MEIVYASLNFNFQFEIFMEIKIPVHFYIKKKKIESIDTSCVLIIRATTSVVAKICKIHKVLNFAHFNPKNTNISTCKNVQIYKVATVTMHICTITVHVQMIFLFFFSLSLLYLALSFVFFSHQRKKEVGGAMWAVVCLI